MRRQEQSWSAQGMPLLPALCSRSGHQRSGTRPASFSLVEREPPILNQIVSSEIGRNKLAAQVAVVVCLHHVDESIHR